MRRPVKKPTRIKPDQKYNSIKVSKLINYIMERGKKNAARDVVYGAFEAIAEKTKKDPLEIYEEALNIIGPSMEIRSKRVGGANYQVPHEVRPERRLALALRWIIDAARSRKGMPMRQRLAEELLLASKNEGEAAKKKDNVHKMAEANRAFAHFAWSGGRK
ncbi:MAG: 30S ribosomal protein S7 [Candidatus Vogelbacteria bacterium RIFOXYD2_FULL_44_9]|uniref:Small ribosomal subunit protein uS7 n=1 Tax=Candidatus Vogelbacteria bacterium RIFOXYD2_FULL_44_9 TaxID=1802441 RepID=A0A1G2QN66_9BACT|nr:MAG: 30S ribosomal protein S7 [Candidatus Vogelbacteria bacterium RIFOXYD2_FULL_44_9]